VIFQENVSFDHYFGPYPQAVNTDGQPFRQTGYAFCRGLTGTLLNANPSGVNPAAGPANVSDVLTTTRTTLQR
jgi:phospholipase C